jgi:hypothetical protein
MDQFAYAGRFPIDPIDVGKHAAAGVMVDVYEEELLEALEPCAFEPITLKQNRRIIRAVDAVRGANGICSRHGAVDNGNAVGGDKVGTLAHLLEQHAHSEDAAHGVAVGPGMGADKEPLAFTKNFDDGLNRVGAKYRGWTDSCRAGEIHFELLHRRLLPFT